VAHLDHHHAHLLQHEAAHELIDDYVMEMSDGDAGGLSLWGDQLIAEDEVDPGADPCDVAPAQPARVHVPVPPLNRAQRCSAAANHHRRSACALRRRKNLRQVVPHASASGAGSRRGPSAGGAAAIHGYGGTRHERGIVRAEPDPQARPPPRAIRVVPQADTRSIS
jgi:hypothetical protein